jgi:peptide/nickel transport system substrate-binding protein
VNARQQNVDLPTLNAWRVVDPLNVGTQFVMERNPYYWKVDPEGNQLPYLDRVVYPLVEDVEVLTLKALNGEVDMMDRHIATNANKAAFTDNMERGGYRFFETLPSFENDAVIAHNLTGSACSSS